MARVTAAEREQLFVWAGGALFVASLAAGVYGYLVTWDTLDAAGGGWWAAAYDVSLFLLFAAHHSVFARSSVKELLSKVIPEHLLRSVYVWTASLLFLAIFVLWRPVGGELYRVPAWLRFIPVAVQLAGVALVVYAVSMIDVLELAGIRQPNDWEPLKVKGPYGWVRHPVYLGWLLAVFGAATMTGDRLLFAVISMVYVVLAVPMEERSLVDAFGDEYEEYRAHVRWRIVPHVY